MELESCQNPVNSHPISTVYQTDFFNARYIYVKYLLELKKNSLSALASVTFPETTLFKLPQRQMVVAAL